MHTPRAWPAAPWKLLAQGSPGSPPLPLMLQAAYWCLALSWSWEAMRQETRPRPCGTAGLGRPPGPAGLCSAAGFQSLHPAPHPTEPHSAPAARLGYLPGPTPSERADAHSTQPHGHRWGGQSRGSSGAPAPTPSQHLGQAELPCSAPGQATGYGICRMLAPSPFHPHFGVSTLCLMGSLLVTTAPRY